MLPLCALTDPLGPLDAPPRPADDRLGPTRGYGAVLASRTRARERGLGKMRQMFTVLLAVSLVLAASDAVTARTYAIGSYTPDVLDGDPDLPYSTVPATLSSVQTDQGDSESGGELSPRGPAQATRVVWHGWWSTIWRWFWASPRS